MIYSTFSLEYALFERGYATVAGIDEAGRGCLAGPVVAAVVVISSPTCYLTGVFDSKLLTRSARESLFDSIIEQVDEYGIGVVSPQDIDQMGISQAASLAMSRAYEQLHEKPDIVIIDGKHVRSPELRGMKFNKADQDHYVVSASSVLAKVYRDRLMSEYARKYPGYGFEKHVGYATIEHKRALQNLGVCEIHRRTYAPVRNIIEGAGSLLMGP